MKKKSDPTISQTEQQLFREAMSHVKPIDNKYADVSRPRPKNQKKYHRPHQVTPNMQGLSDHVEECNTVSSEERLSYCRPGLQTKRFRDLQRGRVLPQRELDLHGLYIAQAREAVLNFITRSQANRQHCVRIIHGKGRRSQDHPILKNKVNQWLQQINGVLAFCSAPEREGGAGAVHVLLKVNKGD